MFAVLPFGFRQTQDEAGDVVPGSEPGAPVRPRFRRVIIWTTIVSAIVFTIYVVARDAGFSLLDLPLPGPR